MGGGNTSAHSRRGAAHIDHLPEPGGLSGSQHNSPGEQAGGRGHKLINPGTGKIPTTATVLLDNDSDAKTKG